MPESNAIPTWIRAILLIAASGVAAGLGAFLGALLLGEHWTAADLGITLPHVVVYATAAGLLILGHQRDPRAVYLGGFFLLVASSFSPQFLDFFNAPSLARLSNLGLLFGSLTPQVFLPAFLWMFVRSFPRMASFGAPARIANAAVRLTAGTGAVLFLVNLSPLIDAGAGTTLATSAWVAPLLQGSATLFWLIVFALVLPALPFAVWRARHARVAERRRVGLFVAGIVVGFAPIVIEVILEAVIPAYGRFASQPLPSSILSLILYPLLLSIPITTSYSVLVGKVLDVRLIARKAVQYTLARQTVMAASVVPFVGLLAYSYERRDETLVNILSGTTPALLAGACLLGVGALRLRKPLLARIDARFFRDQYNSRRILTDLVDKARAASSVSDLGRLFSEEVDRALHVDSIGAFVATAQGTMLEPAVGGFRPLSATSSLATTAAGSTHPLDLDPAKPESTLAMLEPADWAWLAEGAFVLLVPMIAADGRLLGLIGLGEKRSELPFSGEDRLFLGAVASSGALALENRLLLDSAGHVGVESADEFAEAEFRQSAAADQPAAECSNCRTVHMGGTSPCPRCQGATEPALVPNVLLGKFHFQQRIGSGGMGVVYRAVDLTLDREVAIKTLPSSSPGQSIRIRREARAMAAVQHPNLAMIYGAETWRGTPMLIMELLSKGTLARQLRQGPIDVRRALEIGIAMCNVLERIHGAGILHRDIKPSNIGIAADGQPKLLDFGVASVLSAAQQGSRGLRGTEALETSSAETAATMTIDDAAPGENAGFAGTPVYLSPEAVDGSGPDPAQDLWALAIVLHEAISGSNPMMGRDLGETIERILRADPPELREVRPDCPAAVSDLLADALSKDRGQRPTNARRLRQRLESAL